jgi:2-keto-3-deoxy-L-arabinonate dehydratase
MASLQRQHESITVLKGEGTAVETERLIAATDGKLAVFGGHGGIEFLSILRAVAAGLIPAPDCLSIQVKIYELFRNGSPEALAEAERLHKELLPLIIYVIRSIPSLLCYGKRLVAHRLDLGEMIDRALRLRQQSSGFRR